MKKILSTLIAAVMMIVCLPLTAKTTDAADDPNSVKRYTVLLMDVANAVSFMNENGEIIYTADTAVSYVKRSAQKFLTALDEADGENHVAVVAFADNINLVSGFTTNISSVKSKVNELTNEDGFSDIHIALSKAKNLLDNITVEGAVKNVVLVTTGMDSAGSYNYNGVYDEYTIGSEWERMDTGISLYAYANEAVKTANELKQQANIYVLGLFQTMSEVPDEGQSAASFFRLTAKDIASRSSTFYDVTNPEELEFAFGDVAQNVIEGDNDPIILIPGIMGSRLFFDNTCTNCVWPPEYDYFIPPVSLQIIYNQDFNQFSTRIQNNFPLYVRDPFLIQNNLSEADREYGAIDCMKDLVDNLCDRYGNDRNVYVFSYDWRKSNATNATLLKNFIDSLTRDPNVDKVDIVAHSMGGLVTSKYYSLYGSSKLDKVITCGTPYEGSPHIFEAMEQDKVVSDGGIKDKVLSLFGLTREIKLSFAGVSELTPTLKYCSYSPMIERIPSEENLWDFTDVPMDESTYRNMLDIEFGANGANAISFQNSIRDASGYNALLNYDKSYFVLGDNQPTVKDVTMHYDELRSGDFFNGYIEGYWVDDVTYTNKGDGTVPYLSSTMMGQVLFLDSSRRKTVSATHLGMLNKDSDPDNDAITWIENILDDTPQNNDADSDEDSPYIVIRIACPVDVEISDGDDTLSSVNGSESFSSSFGRLDLIGKNNDIKMICMDEDTNLDVNLTGTGTGTMDYTIRYYSADDKLLDERTFENVPITDKTRIKTKADNSEVTVLSIDNNGDGITDVTLTAKKNEILTISDVTTTTTTTSTTTTTTTTSTITAKKSTTTTTTSTTTAKKPTTTTTTSTTTAKKPTTTTTTSTTTPKKPTTTTTTTSTTTAKKPTTTTTTSTTTTKKPTTTTTTSTTTTKKPTTTTTTSTTTAKKSTSTTTTSTTTAKKTTTTSKTTVTTVATTTAITTTTSVTVNTEKKLGDITGDGLINAVDASKILAMYAIASTGGIEPTEDEIKICDVNGDGKVNAVDASKVLAYYAYTSTGGDKSIREFLKE